MSNVEIHRVTISPWARARTIAGMVAAFSLGYLLAGGLDHRDWNVSTQWTKITTVENVVTGERSIIQEQSGSTESKTTPAQNTPGVGLFGAGDK